MHVMTDDAVFAAAFALERRTRIKLAHELIVSLDQEPGPLSEAEWAQAWGEEADRRLLEIEEGRVKELPGEEVMARVRAIVRS